VRRVRLAVQAIPVLYAVVIAGFLITPALLAATSNKNLQQLQQSQNAYANAIGTGSGGPNTDNLKLEAVNFSSRGQVLVNLPNRIRDLILKPYPWQLDNTNQRFGAIGTLIAYALLLLFIRYAWISRGQVFSRAGPVLYPLLFLLIAYSLASGNAGTGFRYRTHLVTLAIAAVVILREQALLVRAERRARAKSFAARPDGGEPPEPLPSPA
jgi:mannitol-specific phosphotransferase system IIBC component